MRTDERDKALEARSDSVTARGAVSVECAALKPDSLGSSRLFCERQEDRWLETARSSVLERNERGDIGL